LGRQSVDSEGVQPYHIHQQENYLDSVLATVILFHTLVASFILAGVAVGARPSLWHYALALFLGLLVGFINLRTNEIQLPALLVLAFGFFLGSSQPRRAWRRTLLIAIWIPCGEFIRAVVQANGVIQLSDTLTSCVSFVFGFTGTHA
jgi:hypothetical protein